MRDQSRLPPVKPDEAAIYELSVSEGMRLYRWLIWPASFLLVLSAAALLFYFVLSWNLFVDAWRELGTFDALLTLILNGCILLGTAIMIYGSICMLRRRSYRSARAVAILAALPCSPLLLVSIPFGIWAWWLLKNRDLQALFDSAETSSLSQKQKA